MCEGSGGALGLSTSRVCCSYFMCEGSGGGARSKHIPCVLLVACWLQAILGSPKAGQLELLQRFLCGYVPDADGAGGTCMCKTRPQHTALPPAQNTPTPINATPLMPPH